MSQQIGMHEAYRIARNSGYIKDQAVSYATMAAIVAEAYKQGYEKAEADKSLTVKERGGTSSGVLPFFCRKAVYYDKRSTDHSTI